MQWRRNVLQLGPDFKTWSGLFSKIGTESTISDCVFNMIFQKLCPDQSGVSVYVPTPLQKCDCMLPSSGHDRRMLHLTTYFIIELQKAKKLENHEWPYWLIGCYLWMAPSMHC